MLDTSIRVLIADDMNTMRRVVTRLCHQLGYTDLVEAINGKDGWEKLQASDKPVGLVISDWNMPHMSGVDFLKKIRSDERFKHLPFLMLTAEADRTQIQEAAKAGASGYCTKPFNAEILRENLIAAFHKARHSSGESGRA